MSAPHLARSYHHLFPLDAFQEMPLEEYQGERYASNICDSDNINYNSDSENIRISNSSFHTMGDTFECFVIFGYLWQKVLLATISSYPVYPVEWLK